MAAAVALQLTASGCRLVAAVSTVVDAVAPDPWLDASACVTPAPAFGTLRFRGWKQESRNNDVEERNWYTKTTIMFNLSWKWRKEERRLTHGQFESRSAMVFRHFSFFPSKTLRLFEYNRYLGLYAGLNFSLCNNSIDVIIRPHQLQRLSWGEHVLTGCNANRGPSAVQLSQHASMHCKCGHC